jgi:hypothetical protein
MPFSAFPKSTFLLRSARVSFFLQEAEEASVNMEGRLMSELCSIFLSTTCSRKYLHFYVTHTHTHTRVQTLQVAEGGEGAFAEVEG